MKKTKRHNRGKSILEMLRDCAAQVDMWPKWKRQNREWALQQEKLLQEYLLNKYNGEDNPNPYLTRTPQKSLAFRQADECDTES